MRVHSPITKSHNSWTREKSHLDALKQSLVMGKWARYFSFTDTGIEHPLSANGGRAGEYVNETQSLPPCGSQPADRRPTGLGTAARDGAWLWRRCHRTTVAPEGPAMAVRWLSQRLYCVWADCFVPCWTTFDNTKHGPGPCESFLPWEQNVREYQ